jgi:hypothetical protein
MFFDQCTEVQEVFADLQDELEKYFIHLPGIKMITVDQLRAKNAKRGNRAVAGKE